MIDAVFILRRLQQKYLDKEKKLYMYFVDLEKAFGKVPRKVLEWVIEEERYTRGNGESSDEFV